MIYALNPGASDARSTRWRTRSKRLGRQVLQSLGDEADIKGIYMELGSPASHQGAVTFSLVPPADRPFTSGEVAQHWRDLIGQPAKLTRLSIDYVQGPGGGQDLTLEMPADSAVSQRAAESLVRRLQEIAGVGQISYSGNAFRSEVRFGSLPRVGALGSTNPRFPAVWAQLDGLEATRLTRGP